VSISPRIVHVDRMRQEWFWGRLVRRGHNFSGGSNPQNLGRSHGDRLGRWM